MARAKVEYVKCDRCKREELQPVGEPKARGDFEARLQNETLAYADLCVRCLDAVRTSWKQFMEWDRPIMQTMWKGPSLDDGKAPPMNPAPDYTPPKPHSMAAAKK